MTLWAWGEWRILRHCSLLNMLSTHVIVPRRVGPDLLGSLAMTTTTGRKRLLKSESTLFLIYMAFILCHSILWNVGECFLELCNNGQRQRNVQKRHARAKKPGCFAINPNLFLFAVLVAVGRCLVFVEPTSAFRLNKISHLESLSSVDSDGSEWNFIPGFVPNM